MSLLEKLQMHLMKKIAESSISDEEKEILIERIGESDSIRAVLQIESARFVRDHLADTYEFTPIRYELRVEAIDIEEIVSFSDETEDAMLEEIVHMSNERALAYARGGAIEEVAGSAHHIMSACIFQSAYRQVNINREARESRSFDYMATQQFEASIDGVSAEEIFEIMNKAVGDCFTYAPILHGSFWQITRNEEALSSPREALTMGEFAPIDRYDGDFGSL